VIGPELEDEVATLFCEASAGAVVTELTSSTTVIATTPLFSPFFIIDVDLDTVAVAAAPWMVVVVVVVVVVLKQVPILRCGCGCGCSCC
jgi:hypothetical protein